jgi:hypothetical protein
MLGLRQHKAKNGEYALVIVSYSMLFRMLPSLLTARSIPNAIEIPLLLANHVDKIAEVATVRVRLRQLVQTILLPLWKNSVITTLGGSPCTSTTSRRKEPTIPSTTTLLHTTHKQNAKSTIFHHLPFTTSVDTKLVNLTTNIEEFLRAPSRLERVQGLGMLICTDCFLNILLLSSQ